MKTITQNLQKELKIKLKSADEIWVAVALLTNKGLEFIQNNLSKNVKQHYVLGIDLPTDPVALETLFEQQFLSDVTVKMFYNQEFYHPKVYIVRSKQSYAAFVGSANCTGNALFSNIEMSFIITSQADCIELLNWYEMIDSNSTSLTPKFISDYRSTYDLRLAKMKEDQKQAKKLKEALKKEYEVTMVSRNTLIRKLKKYREGINYENDKRQRLEDIEDLKISLDYPYFNKVNIDDFFRNHALGHLISIPKPTLKEEKSRFKKMLLFLTDESIDVSVRFDRAFSGDLYIRGVAEATITKILTLHRPEKYSVNNNKINTVLKKYGIDFPKRISPGEKYKATNRFLIEICKETGIDDLSILDFYLFTAANE